MFARRAGLTRSERTYKFSRRFDGLILVLREHIGSLSTIFFAASAFILRERVDLGSLVLVLHHSVTPMLLILVFT
ncbi:hypothetical protein SAMN05518847_104183 [Paenibacillus sp. OV219]|nr:hypothetical protein SAMN05518847_104183 [Paenibacillus sp. OV219]